ncbi:MAG: DUF134 domain-containing protein [Deferribacteres bacterium]|nr:DUF134 domain-containing protein [Deferribacteres bacterium]
MRKPYRKRRIEEPPSFQHFKPCGIPRRQLKTISMSIDEYEALRLADYQGLNHAQAAEKMAISRPTFTRLIEKTRHKIATAIIDGMELTIGGGNIEFANTFHRCRDCGNERLGPAHRKKPDCPACGSTHFEDTAEDFMKNEE